MSSIKIQNRKAKRHFVNTEPIKSSMSIEGLSMFSNDTYDKLKWVAQILLPGISTLWFTISSLWQLPYAAQILGTIAAINLFVGGLVGISKSNYPGDGTMIVDTSDPDKDIYRMELSDPVEDLSNKDSVTFKVKHMRIDN